MPEPDTRIEAGDIFEIEGRVEDFEDLMALQTLVVDAAPAPEIKALQSPDIGIGEVTLSPRSQLAGRSIRELRFRELYGLSIIAIWRAGRPYRFDLRDMELRFGDAILVYGPRSKLALLTHNDDFIVLHEGLRERYRENKVPVAGFVMVAVLAAAAFGVVPIWLAALSGAAAMVVFRCLTPSEAYEHIEWKAIVLVAGMLTLGLAMERSGAAAMIADGVLGTLSPLGPYGVISGLFFTSVLAALFMPTAAVAVLMSRIFLSDASALGVDPQAAMMVVAIASSCAFMSPVGHPVNLLVMGVGGYRFTDYTRVGLGLTLVVYAVVMIVLPIFWPLGA